MCNYTKTMATVQAMEKKYPEVEVSYEFVDAVAMRLVQWPNSYDVLITDNIVAVDNSQRNDFVDKNDIRKDYE